MSKEKEPIIGIPGWKINETLFGVPVSYVEFFQGYGEVKILSMTSRIDDSLDLLVIPGGADVDPLRYNTIPSFYTSKPDPFKEYFDTRILPKYIEAGVPVFGICRGIQSIAVLYGARLIQDMEHETNGTSRSERVHELLLDDEFKKVFFKECNIKSNDVKIKVNSLHHQCVSTILFPECLQVLAAYNGKRNSKCIEVIRHRTLPIIAVQYHPEELGFDILSDYLIESLIARSKNYNKDLEVILDHGEIRNV